MRKEVKICDGCGRVQADVNHWTIVGQWINPQGDKALVLSDSEHTPTGFLGCQTLYDVCGSACEQKLISELRTQAKV